MKHGRGAVVPVILSGGNGSRLWPMSRELYPKQMLPLLGEVSLLQQTAWRVRGRGFSAPLLVCGEEHRFVVAEQLAALGVQPSEIVLEPVARNTAPAIAVAAMLLERTHPDALMLVCPADHAIDDLDAFHDAVDAAARAARAGHLVSFGIPASVPGMFLFPPRLLLEELGKQCPELCASVSTALEHAQRDLSFLRLGARAFAEAPSISIDHAVMEHTRRAAVVRGGFTWSDVGSWSALWQMAEHDQNGNVALGDVVSRDTSDCYVRAEDLLVATVGLRDTIVVATKDAVLVADRSADQQVKDVVATLRARGRSETIAHRVVYRPWGCHESVDSGPGYQVNHITVKPGHHLSLQKHSYRAAHWVVISGTAEVVRDDDVLILTDRMSVDVPLGCVHRLGNPGPELLHLVEVQTGTYLGEDDIVRLEDAYGRSVATPAG
jgi:mannose-1-phosphate guanylyltransferase / mannose-6-phosphate isomerase